MGKNAGVKRGLPGQLFSAVFWEAQVSVNKCSLCPSLCRTKLPLHACYSTELRSRKRVHYFQMNQRFRLLGRTVLFTGCHVHVPSRSSLSQCESSNGLIYVAVPLRAHAGKPSFSTHTNSKVPSFSMQLIEITILFRIRASAEITSFACVSALFSRAQFIYRTIKTPVFAATMLHRLPIKETNCSRFSRLEGVCEYGQPVAPASAAPAK